MTMPEAFHIEEDDLIQYALGTLKEAQLGTMTAHISMCNTCRSELARIQVELACFAAVQPEEGELPADAKDRFMARLTSDAPAAESKLGQFRDKSRVYLAGKAVNNWFASPMPLRILSGLLAAACVFLAYDDLSHIHENRQLLPEMKRLANETAELDELRDFLRGNNTQQVTLHVKPVLQKEPEGHAVYSAATGKLVFTASNMAELPDGKAYELWVLPAGGGAPVPAGTFVPDRQGNGAVIFPNIPTNVQASGFGITVEDAKGAAKPTPPILLSGQ
jgi:anti-sigma-K factor RskA